MTTLTKTEAEAILERLTDKTLSFGCEVKDLGRSSGDYVVAGRNPYKKGLVDCLEKKVLSVYSFSTERLKVLGHPILIGDVLERIRMARKNTGGGQTVSACLGRELARLEQNARLLKLWSSCGFTSSLQEIYNRIEWEEPAPRCSFEATANHYDKSKWLAKPSPFADLFIFLKEIGL